MLGSYPISYFWILINLEKLTIISCVSENEPD